MVVENDDQQDSLPSQGADLGKGAGFLVLSTGMHRRRLLWECIAGIRRHYPTAPVHVVSDTPVDCGFTWVRAARGVDSRRYKTRLAAISPFDVTVVVDDDTVIHKPFGRAEEWLKGNDIALAPDFSFPTLGAYLRRARGGGHVVESKKWIHGGNTDKPYFSSGVMVFKRSTQVSSLFFAWNEEWMRHQQMDQQPLIAAIERTGISITSLPHAMNYIPNVHGKGKSYSAMEAYVLHFWRDKVPSVEAYCREMGFPSASAHPIAQQMERLGDKASTNREGGGCISDQVRAVGAAISDTAPCRLLVFGGGKRSAFWGRLNRGGLTYFVEDQPSWVKRRTEAGHSALLYRYQTTRGVRRVCPASLPEELYQEWDIVVIDGPPGHRAGDPGREVPIHWASILSGDPMLFVCDWGRPWDQMLCDQYLEHPDTVILDGALPAMAVWHRNRVNKKRLLGYI